MAILKIEDLKVHYFTSRGVVKAVENANLELNEGDALGLVGESGCGKSTIALSILRLIPPPGKIVSGKILLHGEDLLTKSEEELNKIRWKEISIVPQASMNSFNPVLRISEQIIEAILAHKRVEKTEALTRIKELFELVGIDQSRVNSYPHEFSGGMKQRAMIAMALALNPTVVIADEPTTGLDALAQAHVLKLIEDLQKKFKLSMILISHDLSIVSEICNKCAVMYAGKIVEYGDIVFIFKESSHPYAQSLIKSFPSVKSRTDLLSIPGNPPNLINPPSGCRFHPRCQFAKDVCSKVEPILEEVKKGHYVACHLFR